MIIQSYIKLKKLFKKKMLLQFFIWRNSDMHCIDFAYTDSSRFQITIDFYLFYLQTSKQMITYTNLRTCTLCFGSSVWNQRWAQARYCWRVMAEHYWEWSPLRKESTVDFSRWSEDRAFQSTIVLGKKENLKTFVRLDKVKKQKPSAVERVERDGEMVEQGDEVISVTACCRPCRMSIGAMIFSCQIRLTNLAHQSAMKH